MTCTEVSGDGWRTRATVSPEQSGSGVDANANASVSLLSPARANVKHTDWSEWDATGAESEPELAGSLHKRDLGCPRTWRGFYWVLVPVVLKDSQIRSRDVRIHTNEKCPLGGSAALTGPAVLPRTVGFTASVAEAA